MSKYVHRSKIKVNAESETGDDSEVRIPYIEV